MSRRLPRSFFARSAVAVAPDLLGQTLVRILPSGARLAVRIVETEAYEQDDPASHAFGGVTRRNEVMFGRAGLLYVYFVYGMHWCANVVTGKDGEGSAVLLRAGEPTEGAVEMERNRKGRAPLTTGPARLAQALALSGADNGLDLTVADRCWFERGSEARIDILSGPRIGMRRAAEVPWRFWERGDPFVSGTRALNARAEPPTR
ncbi:MAG: DNA-3-methyladenine glycosylase [Actinomycetota bacterium]|nr:DNA-3-methyladenine glycosylase [Actinomycetota bacterium]